MELITSSQSWALVALAVSSMLFVTFNPGVIIDVGAGPLRFRIEGGGKRD